MKSRKSIPTIIAAAAAAVVILLAVVHFSKVANAFKIAGSLKSGDVSQTQALIEKHPGCLNTRPAFAPRWLARFMDFPQEDYVLEQACSFGSYDIARRMVELGADPNKGDYLTPLGAVLQVKHTGCYDMAVWLYENGAEAEIVTNLWGLPAYSAIWAIADSASNDECPEEEVEKLFDYFYERMGDTVGGEKSDTLDDWPYILFLCAEYGHGGIIERILDKGLCAVDDRTGDETALMAAARFGNAQIVRLLLSRGADSSLTDDNGRTAAQLAQQYAKDPEEIIKLLNEQ